MEVDEALAKLGTIGLWQSLVYTGWAIACCFAAAIALMGPIFIAAMPEQYHCRLSENETFIVNANNETDQCHVYRNGTGKIPCSNGIEFQNVDFGSSIITEWDLVCDRNFLGELTITLKVVGSTLGSFFLPVMADKFGRKRMYYLLLFLYTVFEAAHVVAYHYWLFVLLRVISGCLQTGVYISSFVAACETLQAKQRTFGGIFIQTWWAIGMLFLCMCAYFIRDWRHLQLTIALVPLVSFSYFFFIPETVPWLASNGRIDEAEKILVKAAQMNKVHMPEKPLRSSQSTERLSNNSPVKEASTMDIVRNVTLRKILCCMCVLWFANSIVYWGISFTSTMLSSDRYLNFFFNSLIEIPAMIFSLLALQRWGRRLPNFIFFILAGLTVLIVIFIPLKTASGVSLKPLRMFLTMFGKWAITCTFNSVILYTTEVFPTNARNTGFGLCTLTARIGTMISPFTVSLAKMIPWLPGVIFAVVAFVSAFVCLLLPETNKRPLPDTIEQISSWYTEQKYWSFKMPEAEPAAITPVQPSNDNTHTVEKIDFRVTQV
ncbi:organic cation transporter protein-like [Tubulanus polymorphus]|uniref:organic cation transporter protein-like n=1 Tax=Tubulanus polymorphus TaxID=672921 RepID=UPI003DA385E8